MILVAIVVFMELSFFGRLRLMAPTPFDVAKRTSFASTVFDATLVGVLCRSGGRQLIVAYFILVRYLREIMIELTRRRNQLPAAACDSENLVCTFGGLLNMLGGP